MSNRYRDPGEFCWINVLTPAPADARRFFSELLGWEWAEIPGMGHLIKVGGRDAGGFFDLDGPGTPPGTPPQIGVMIRVENADLTCARVTAAGGTAQPAFDIGDRGRMAVCHDPTGAAFDIWEPRGSQGSDANPMVRGAPSWFEALTTDAQRARNFYAGLFGWRAEVTPMGGFSYTTFQRNGRAVGGLLELRPEMSTRQPGWGTFFTVPDARAVVEHAESLGARIRMPVRQVDGVGRFAGIDSPQGVGFQVIEYEAAPAC